MQFSLGHAILLLYFLWWLFKLIKATPRRLNESRYQEYLSATKKEIRAYIAAMPMEYCEILQQILYGIAAIVMVVHTVLCLYVGAITPYWIVKAICYLEAVETFYSMLSNWSTVYEYLFTNDIYEFPYSKFKEWVSVLTGYACYIAAIITLLPR